MALRLYAAGRVEAGKQFRRVNGHMHFQPCEPPSNGMSPSRVSRLVKECDIADDSDPRRLSRLPLDVQKKLVKKYTTACTLLDLIPEEVGLPHSPHGTSSPLSAC